MILGKSISDTATIAASSQNANLPAVAVQRYQPRDIWRTFNNDDQYITFNLGSPKAFNAVACLYNNADESALWRIRTADTNANLTASPTYDSSTISMRNSGDDDEYSRFHSVKNVGSLTNQWIRLDFTMLTGMTTLDIGRIMVMNAFTKAIAYDWQQTALEDAYIIPTISGMWSHAGRRRREISATYLNLSNDQSFTTMSGLEYRSFSSPICMSIDETQASRQTDWTYYGVISSASNVYHFSDLNMKQITFIEFERP